MSTNKSSPSKKSYAQAASTPAATGSQLDHGTPQSRVVSPVGTTAFDESEGSQFDLANLLANRLYRNAAASISALPTKSELVEKLAGQPEWSVDRTGFTSEQLPWVLLYVTDVEMVMPVDKEQSK